MVYLNISLVNLLLSQLTFLVRQFDKILKLNIFFCVSQYTNSCMYIFYSGWMLTYNCHLPSNTPLQSIFQPCSTCRGEICVFYIDFVARFRY